MVWIVDPYFQTVTVFRPEQHPVLFNIAETIHLDPLWKGLQIPVARILEE